MDFRFLNHFPNALTGATIQGWLRKWDDNGLIAPKKIDWSKLAAADVVIFSEEDIHGFDQYLPQIISHVKIVAMTQGADGVTVWKTELMQHFPTTPKKVKDTTGAGDVFAAAFLIRFFQTKNIGEAARFANAKAGESLRKTFF